MSTNADDDLIEVLGNSHLQVSARLQGWNYVLGLTVTEDGITHIISSKRYIPFILSYVKSEKLDELVNIAYRCLINISAHERGCLTLIKDKSDILKHLLHDIYDCKSRFILYKCYIISNISSFSEICQKMVDIIASDKLLGKLMACYCANDSDTRKKYDFLTLVFANLSRLTSGRKLLLNDTMFLSQILAFMNHKEPEIRRLGIAFILRNCCLETGMHEALLDDYNILPEILLPLMGSEEYEDDEMEKLPIECQYLDTSKERDGSSVVRRILVQALIALCYSEKSWNYLKMKGTYYVVRDLHKWEKNESVKEVIEHLVTYFLVEQYSYPSQSENYFSEDSSLIQQLESEMIKDIPDFVI